MAKVSAIMKNRRRRQMAEHGRSVRLALKAKVRDRKAPPEERFQAVLTLAKLPRNASPVRVRNRCELTGRPRGYYRKMRISRIALRELASMGQIPGMTKASW